jgi:hypothetical protein
LRFIMIWFFVIWIACGIFGYLVFRWDVKRTGIWTQGARALGLVLATLFAPGMAIMACFVLLMSLKDWDKPASW